MIPVSTILQVGAFYNATGFSYLYEPLFGGAPERKTMIYIRDGDGHIVGGILDDATKLARVIS